MPKNVGGSSGSSASVSTSFARGSPPASTNKPSQSNSVGGSLDKQKPQASGWNGKSAFVAKGDNIPPAPPRPDLRQVRRQNQVKDDQMVDYKPVNVLGYVPVSKRITATEAKMLDRLGLLRKLAFNNIQQQAYEKSEKLYPNPQTFPNHVPADKDARIKWLGNDGHRDAFRHAYWNAMMTQQFGVDWARQFATAHEGAPGNPANREAMDLHNNAVGRYIGLNNPKATPEQLARLVQDAMAQGRTVVIAKNGNLQWSDCVALWQHGKSNDSLDVGGQPIPEGNAYPEYRRSPTGS